MSTATPETLGHPHDHAHDHGHDHDHAHDHPHGWRRWLFATNHKDIGTLYLVFSFVMFIIGAAMSVVIRTELMHPGLQHVSPEFFNQMTTVHALVMIFGGVMPAFVGLANWMVPLQIGAPDMALPRMNNWSFWIMPFAFAMLLLTPPIIGALSRLAVGDAGFGLDATADADRGVYVPAEVTQRLTVLIVAAARTWRSRT